ncbi:MAG TPA: RodZ domain-containing protein [Bryobacteraceae bacterium]|nr:RodZ domain-containing protein [Bryobacteraceae bacterium]
MNSIGQTLLRARSERGLTLEELATRTRINRKYLEAIEKDKPDAIPGGFFYKSFVRQYAGALSPDALKAVENLLAREEPKPPTPEEDAVMMQALAAAPSQARVPGANRPIGIYLVFLGLVVVGTSGLYVWWHKAEQTQAAVPPPRVVAETSPISAKPEPAPVKAEEPPPAPASTVPSTPAPVATPATTPATTGDEKVVLNVAATEMTWFSVSADGKTVFSGTLQPGEAKTFAAKENAKMKVGNAGGLDVKLNGVPTGPLGPPAQIRSVVFTPTGFEIIKPAPKPDATNPPSATQIER